MTAGVSNILLTTIPLFAMVASVLQAEISSGRHDDRGGVPVWSSFLPGGILLERGSCIGQGFGNINFFKEELLVWLKDG